MQWTSRKFEQSNESLCSVEPTVLVCTFCSIGVSGKGFIWENSGGTSRKDKQCYRHSIAKATDKQEMTLQAIP